MRCDFCGGDYPNGHCSYQSSSQGEVQYVSNQGRPGNFSNNNNFSQGWRNNPNQNFGWKQDVGPSNRQPPYQQQQQHYPSVHDRTTKLEDTLEKFMQASLTNQKNTEASIKNLETKVGQLAKQLSDQQAGQFSANTQTNPKEHCKSITTRSGKVVGRGIGYNLAVEEEMPTYAKFMKELLTKKRRFSEETVELEAGCSAIIQKSLPQKSKDLGSFTIPVTIRTLPVGKTMFDLGASINLMPLSMLRRIGDLEVRPTRMALQLVDRSMKYPYGVAEDVLVKVDKFMFPVDFVVMDIEEDTEVPLILGRPFMKTAKVIIDVDDGKLKVRVQDDEVNFNVFEAMQDPKDKQQCFKMDVIDEIFLSSRKQLTKASPLEKALIGACDDLEDDEEKKVDEYLTHMNSAKEIASNDIQLDKLQQENRTESQKLELKVLPPHLKYVFLADGGNKPVVISSALTASEEEKLILVLKANKGAIG
ncbi:uncharacterized protein LOC114163487 [Vigna unguiculata]|uniref:uncharacterized protein LOC114163487 n=1 Tax=Vigna unguiculata TaxID=3917 RepID=UPI0010168D6A|nr:uncharacterized protein LOC114163487 [Vigna unguiculata]